MNYSVNLRVLKELIDLFIVDERGKVVDRFYLPTGPDLVDYTLRDLHIKISCIRIQMSALGNWLAEELRALGWDAVCYIPANDKKGKVKEVVFSKHSQEAQLAKAIVKCRQRLLAELERTWNRVYFFLESQGNEFLLDKIDLCLDGRNKKDFLLDNMESFFALPEGKNLYYFLFMDYIGFYNGEFEAQDKIFELAYTNEDVLRLATIPGISYTAALYYVFTVEHLGKSCTNKAIASYLGLSPGFHKTKGDPLARAFLVQAAARILHSDVISPLKMWGLTIAKKASIKVAQVAIARKLATLMYKLLIEKKEYNEMGC
jgi:transposase